MATSRTMARPPVAEQGTTLAAFIDGELTSERARTTSLNDSARTVITTSAAFVALIVAVAALVLGQDFTVGGTDDPWAVAARTFAVSALVAFAAAGFFASRVQWLRPVRVASGRALVEMTDSEIWQYDETDARNLTSWHKANTIVSLRVANDQRSRHLKAAGVAQIVGAGLVTVAVLCGFLARPPAASQTPQLVRVCLDQPCPTATAAP